MNLHDLTGEELFEKFGDSILAKFRPEVLIREERVFDFLPEIKKNNWIDEKILQTWIVFFCSKKVPWLIVEKGKTKVLWKGRVI